jgi:hypothetical protein
MGVRRQRTNVSIAGDRRGFAANEDSADAGTGDGSAMIGDISYSRCGWHKFN